MQRANELFGKEIVNQATGVKQATVRELIFDQEARNIVALLVGGGLLGHNMVVRWSSIMSVGDVIVVEGEALLAVGSEDPEVADLRKQAHRITDTNIITEAGEKSGTVSDLFVDERGRVVGYEVKQGLLKDLGGRKFLPMENVRGVGRDAIVAINSDLVSIKDAEKGRGQTNPGRT